MSLDILLVNPILSRTDFETPLGLLYVSRICSGLGHNTRVVDLAFEYGLGYLRNFKSGKAFDIVGIYSMSPMIGNALASASIAKQRWPGAKVILGGPHPTLFPEDVLANKDVDFVVMGEAEDTLPEFFSRFERGDASFDNVKGIGFKAGNNIVVNERREPIPDLDRLPFPDRLELDTLEGYENLAAIKVIFGKRTLNMAASRGCCFNCAFCQPALNKIHGNKVRYRSVENVVEEIKYLKDNWGIEAVWFEDDTITVRKDWMLEFCRRIGGSNHGISWSCNSRLDTVDEELLKAMKDAGCVQVRYGLESGSQNVLDRDFNKGTKIPSVKDVFAMTRRIGIRTYAYVMVGGRHETQETIKETEKMLDEIRPDHIQLAITTLLPETRLKEEMEADPSAKILTTRYEDMKLFEKCNFDTADLKAAETEFIYRDLFNKFHFFRLRDILNRDFFKWLNANGAFFFFLVRTAPGNKIFFSVKLAFSYLTLALRLILLKVPLLNRADGLFFGKRLSFPPLEI